MTQAIHACPAQLQAHANHKAAIVRLSTVRPIPVDPGPYPTRDWIMVATPPLTEPTVTRIMATVAKEHGKTFEDIIGRRRREDFIEARHDAVVAVRKAKPHLSLPHIGRYFLRHHTTIMMVLRNRGVK